MSAGGSMSTPIDRATEALRRHVSTAIATVKAGLPSDRALRDSSGIARTAEAVLLREVEHGGPLTRPGLNIAARAALSAALTDPDLTHALALHQVESHGMGPSAPDGCSCGDFIIPAPYQSEYEDISSRRGRAFAAHQADAIRSAVLGGAE